MSEARAIAPSPPAGWAEVPLGRAADVVFSNVDKKAWPSEPLVKLCNYVDVYQHDYLGADHPYMTATASHAEVAKFGLRPGDVVITKDSETPDDIGVPTIVDAVDGVVVCGYHLALIRPRDGNNPIFLAKQLGQQRLRSYFAKEANGLTRYGLSNASVKGAPLWLPPIKEQERIATVLRAVDDAIHQGAMVLAKHTLVRQALLQALTSSGVDEHGEARDPVTHPELFESSKVGLIPRAWRVVEVQDVFSRRVERGLRGLPVMAVTKDRGLIPREEVERRVESALTPEEHSLVRDGDIVYNMMRMWQGVLGRAERDCLVSPAYVVMKPKSGCDSRFAAYLFSSPMAVSRFRRWSQGIVDDRLRLYFHDLAKIEFAVPRSTEEQMHVASTLQAADELVAGAAARINVLRDLRRGLTDDLVSGSVRLVVPCGACQ